MLGISLIFLTGCAVDLVVPENDINSPATEDSSIDENPAGVSGTGKGTLKIYLTDASGDFLELNIIVSRIEGHIAVEGEEEEGSWEELGDWQPNGLPVDLLTLEGKSLLLGSMELAPNHYTQLRVFLKEKAELILEGPGGSPVTEILEIPSSENTGIKLNRPFDIVEDGITKLTLDFDVEKSVIETGNGNYKMKPVIHVTSEIISEGQFNTGLVSGSVSYYESTNPTLLPPVVGASVSLSGGEYIFVYNAITLEDGSFNFLEDVPVGNCVLNVDADADDIYEYSEIIEVKVDDVTVVNVVLLAEEPGGISGSVIDSVTEEAIEGATVSVELVSTIFIFESSALTDGDGNFSLEQLPVGFYTLMILADGYDEYNDATLGGIEVTSGVDTPIVTIELPPITH